MDAIQINIAEPCHENWQNMTDTEKGRFCGSCKKEVIDFTLMNNNQVYTTLLSGDADMCGRFSNTQLENAIEYAVEKKQYWHKYFFGLFIPAFLLSKQSTAQGTLKGKVACTRPVENVVTMGIVARPIEKKFELIGHVVDATTKLRINASVEIKNTTNGITTDNSGFFKLVGNVTNSIVTLAVSSVGYETKEMDITIPANGFKMEDIEIALQNQVQQLDTVVVKSYATQGKYVVMGAMVSSVKVTNYRITNTVMKIVTNLTDSLKVYPNPVNRGNVFNVDLKLKPKENYTLQIMDAAGKVVYQKQIKPIAKKHNEQLQADSRWSNGTYFIRIIDSKNKLISTSRFIVE